MNLEGKTALVTGASSGVGRALAKRLAKDGVLLAISARRTEALAELADEIVAAGATARPVVIAADLSKRGAARRAGEAALSALRRVDMLFNNAGISIGGAQAIVGDEDMGRGVFETNYWSALALTQLLVPPMVGRGIGAVINVSSVVTVTPIPLTGHYASSKAALSLSSEVLRMELRGTGVHVLSVVLGAIKTAMLAEVDAMTGTTGLLARVPLGDVDTLAGKIVRDLERGKGTLVYPGVLGFTRHLPTLAMRASSRMMRRVHVRSGHMMQGGSQGDPLVLKARADNQ